LAAWENRLDDAFVAADAVEAACAARAAVAAELNVDVVRAALAAAVAAATGLYLTRVVVALAAAAAAAEALAAAAAEAAVAPVLPNMEKRDPIPPPCMDSISARSFMSFLESFLSFRRGILLIQDILVQPLFILFGVLLH
jgi:hypothetical protein